MSDATKKVLVVLYSHPELYPPTLNAVMNLAGHMGEVHVLYRPHKKDEWSWPANVLLHPSGKPIGVRQFMTSDWRTRMVAHARFAMDLLRLMRRIRPDIVLLYDPYPALFYRLIHPLLPRKPFLWYHSHDAIDRRDLESGNIMIQQLRKSETFVLDHADLFTLPAVERKPFYDLGNFRGNYWTIPNFPSLKVFSAAPSRTLDGELVLAFQGSICQGRGLEDVITSLPITIAGRPVHFSITGFCYNAAYMDSLRRQIAALPEPDAVSIHDAVPYARLREAQSDAHVGWAYYGVNSSMDVSIGTASNKFFESCAMGLPVLYNAGNTFSAYTQYAWALPVRPGREDLAAQLTRVAGDYENLSALARRQFLEELNYEIAFEEVLKFLPHA